MCGVMTSRALMQLVVWLKHYFGVLVIFDCCFVDDGAMTIVTEQGL